MDPMATVTLDLLYNSEVATVPEFVHLRAEVAAGTSTHQYHES
jgi:hypothetical protein